MVTLNKGFDAAEKLIQRNREKRSDVIFRFYLRPNSRSRVVFLSDEPDAVVKEIELRVNNKWDAYVVPDDFTVPAGLKLRPSLVGYFTIIELVEIETRSGLKITNPVRILRTKYGTLEILKRQFEKRKGLRGCVFEVERTTNEKTPSVGDIWDFEKKLSDDELNSLNPNAQLLDFTKILKFPSSEELMKILSESAQSVTEKPQVVTEVVDW